jgi:putative nucleotidyltransferase with HDIG domain
VKLATRTFLWSLLPFAVLLIGSFWAAETRVLSKVREGLEISVKQTQATLAKIRARDGEHNSRLLRIVSQNPALKAVVQQLLGDRADAQARRTVEQQLAEIGEELGFDFLLVSDGDGTPLAGSMLEPGSITQEGRLQPLDLGKRPPPLQGYFTSAGRTYQVTSIPIDEGTENLGTLSVGERFDLSAVPGEAILMRKGEIVESNTPGLPLKEAQAGLRGCAADAECEIQLRGETYVSQPLEEVSQAEEASQGSGDGYQVRTLQSVDAATRDIQAVLRRAFALAGLGALAAAVLVSGLSSRSIVRPIAQVIARLHESARTGELPEFDSQRERIHEIRALTASFNQAAAAIRDGQARLQRASVEFIESLASALDARDPYTAGHSRRVSQYATATAQAMGLAPAQIQEIRVGALLHDIGKIGITDAILQKPGRLTAEEDALIRQHPSIGRRILEGVNGFQPYLNVVELHHENWDGSGYPKGLRQEATPLTARVVKIADAWDAMTSDRPYRQGMSRNQALAMLRKASGTQMDPVIIEVFCSLWGADEIAAPPATRQAAESLPTTSLTRLAEAVEPETRVEIPLREQQDA